jgi:hypothetical protein
MKTKLGVGIVFLLLVIAVGAAIIGTIAVLREGEEPSGLEVVDIKIRDPKPSILNDRSVTIDHGESVTLNLTVQNRGENITRGDAYTVGVAVITNAGDVYWRLPPEQLIGVDLGPGGESDHTFTVINKKELPFRGQCEFQAYIKSVQTGEEIARSDIVTIAVRYPA